MSHSLSPAVTMSHGSGFIYSGSALRKREGPFLSLLAAPELEQLDPGGAAHPKGDPAQLWVWGAGAQPEAPSPPLHLLLLPHPHPKTPEKPSPGLTSHTFSWDLIVGQVVNSSVPQEMGFAQSTNKSMKLHTTQG